MNPYLRLMRLHQPTGIWLLLWPCWWGIALASDGMPSLRLMALFALGAVVMRSAGCIVNDIWDRDFDRQVERTRGRPLASGELSLRQALILLATLLVIALGIVLALPRIDFWLAALSLILVVLYPAMKRFTWWPQAFLGLTFNWGALMGYAAVSGRLAAPAFALYAAGFFWTLGYDTIYAHQDARDDQKAGIKSTALILGQHTKPALFCFYSMMLLGLVLAGAWQQLGIIFYAMLIPVILHSLWQIMSLRQEKPADCMEKFKANRITGALIWMAFMAEWLF